MKLQEKFTKSRLMVVEQDKDGKPESVLLTGLFAISDELSLSGRIYPQGVLESAVEQVQKTIDQNGPLFSGSGTHPQTGQLELPGVSHQVEAIWQNEDNTKEFYATLRILGTSQGRNLWILIKGGGSIGLSLTGSGQVTTETRNKQKVEVVQPGYSIHRIDASLPGSGGFPQAKVNKNSQVFESLDLEANKEIQGLSEEDKYKRFLQARRSGFSGSLDDYKNKILMERKPLSNAELKRFGEAKRAGFRGSPEAYRKLLEKNKRR